MDLHPWPSILARPLTLASNVRQSTLAAWPVLFPALAGTTLVIKHTRPFVVLAWFGTCRCFHFHHTFLYIINTHFYKINKIISGGIYLWVITDQKKKKRRIITQDKNYKGRGATLEFVCTYEKRARQKPTRTAPKFSSPWPWCWYNSVPIDISWTLSQFFDVVLRICFGVLHHRTLYI